MIPHNKPTIGEEEVLAAMTVLKSRNLSQGDEVKAFEDEICDFLGYEKGHAMAVSSGSAALYMAIRGFDFYNHINSIAIPAYSCSALKNAVCLANKIPLYVDVGTNSVNIDTSASIIKKADLIVIPHMFGIPTTIKKENVIEDCAQAIGATIDGQKVGTQAQISIFSFYATKPITCGGEGGMVVSKERKIIDFLKDLRDFDTKNDSKIRFNFQMTEIQASVGRVQLRKLEAFIQRRRYLADRYCKSGIPLWSRSEGGIDYRGIIKSKNPQKIIKNLKENGISAIIPIEASELLCDKELVPNAYKLTQSLVSIPLYPSLSDNNQNYIIEKIIKYANQEGCL